MDEKMNNGAQPQNTPAPEVSREVKKEPPKSAPPKKELTPAEMQRRRKRLVMPLFFLVFAGVMWLIFAPSKKEDDNTAGQGGFNTELPIPNAEGIVGDKRTAYEQEAQRQREQDKMRSLQDFSSMLEQSVQQEENTAAPMEYREGTELAGSEASEQPGRGALQSSAYANRDINRQLGEWHEQPAVDSAGLATEQRMRELERRLDEAEGKKSAADEQLELIEKSYAIAARYMPGQADGQENRAADAGGRDKVIARPVSRVRKNVVSLLAAPMSDAEFIEAFGKMRNMGFFTLAADEQVTQKNSIRACVYRSVTLTGGKELQIRLLEPMRAGDILIPENTVITGVCRVDGERMEVTVNSIQYEGNIIPVELYVYDLDGQRGISVPGNDEVNAAKEIASQMAQSAGTNITITGDAGSQFAADVGKSLVQGASQYVSKKMGVVKVTLKADYRLLLLPKTQ